MLFEITLVSLIYLFQTELKEMLWRAIREDLDSLESVSDVLLVLDVVIGFLSSAGGDPEQRVSFYLHDVLRYPHGTQGAGPLQSRRVRAHLICIIFVVNCCSTGRRCVKPETHTQLLESPVC